MSTSQGGTAPESASSVPGVWVVRAGRQGEAVGHNLASGDVTIEWDDWVAPDLSRFESQDAYGDYIEEHFRDLTLGKRQSARHQIWRFYHEIQLGDLVVLPLKHYGSADEWIAIGRVRGEAARDTSRPALPQHHRAVEWLSRAVSKVVVRARSSRLDRQQRHGVRRAGSRGCPTHPASRPNMARILVLAPPATNHRQAARCAEAPHRHQRRRRCS